ncbi:MAG TPA: hypothetical protein VJ022_10970 [Anaerolineales bacterium]|nr:hypothetical protein [Anaerolineales bacterium]
MPSSLTLQPALIELSFIDRAILETLVYSDIFEYPLQLKELHRFLPERVDIEKLPGAIASLHEYVGRKDDYYFLAGREETVGIRKQREARSRKLLPRAIQYGCVLGSLPFIRMVALTGSLAVMNVSKDSDFDYMLVTAPGRVWTARVFALLFNRLVRPFGPAICPNLIVSETALEWPQHDLYSARELYQMIPIMGMDVYHRLMKANQWVREFFPNASITTSEVFKTSEVWKLFELPLRGKPGDSFERWEMNRKIAKFSKQEGFGEETVFTAEVCQGNFHHHRRRTREVFQERLNNLSVGPSLLSGGEPGMRAR